MIEPRNLTEIEKAELLFALKQAPEWQDKVRAYILYTEQLESIMAFELGKNESANKV